MDWKAALLKFNLKPYKERPVAGDAGSGSDLPDPGVAVRQKNIGKRAEWIQSWTEQPE